MSETRIYATEKNGERFEVDDLYFFEEEYIHTLNGNSNYKFDIEIDGINIIDLRKENESLKALVDEISVLITQFKKARNSTRSIEAIAKIVVWNVEQEDRIGKEKRELLKSTD